MYMRPECPQISNRCSQEGINENMNDGIICFEINSVSQQTIYEPLHDKTNNVAVRPAKTQIRPV